MDEDRLSPVLGRLIDQAKGAADALGTQGPGVETVALLTDEGDIYTGAVLHSDEPGDEDPDGLVRSAACLALEQAQEAGAGEILAAAIAAPFDTADTVVVRAATYECLAGLDQELSLVLKQHGRWVMVSASRITPSP